MTDRRLIEDSLPLAEVSAFSAKEKNIRHGHLSTLHIWWARRPLAAARAAILGSLLPSGGTDEERQRSHELIVSACDWKNISSPAHAAAVRGALAEALGRSLNDVVLYDPFAGGGAIPLEGVRLGLHVVANDLNPIAHLLQRCTTEFPQRFAGRPKPSFSKKNMTSYGPGDALALDFEHWAAQLQERARKRLDGCYSVGEARGSSVAAYFWVRILSCANPSCRGRIPLIKQYWLSKAGNISLIPRFAKGDFSFDVGVPGDHFDPSVGTVDRDKVSCPHCQQVTTGQQLRAAGATRWPERMVAVFEVGPGRGTRRYRAAKGSDELAYARAQNALKQLERERPELFPTEELPYLRSIFNVHVYGIRRWRDLFNDRQLLTLGVLCESVAEIYREMVSATGDEAYAAAIAAYLGLLVDRVADYNSSICRWDNSRESLSNTFSRQALGMVWDYAETDPYAGGSGSLASSIDWISRVLRHCASCPVPAVVTRGSAARKNPVLHDGSVDLVITDPPYYDAVPYADLSDFFYVWAKRSLGEVFPDVFATELTPKRDEAVQLAERNKEYSYKTKDRFEELLTDAFRVARTSLKPEGLCAVMFAHKSTSAWETLLASLLRSGLVVTASWPLDTEMGSRLRSQNSAALASSVLIVCRPVATSDDGFLDDVEPALKARLHERLDYFWSQGIRGADFFMSAIGPAVEVFGRHKRVLKLSGEEVSIAELLDKVRGIVADYALQRIVHGEAAGNVDDSSRFYVIWRWAFGTTEVEAGEAIHMAQSMGVEFDALVADKGVLNKKGDKVSLKGPLDRKKVKGLGEPAATGTLAPLIDVLHRAANLWAAGERQDLADFLATALPPGGADRMQRLAQSIVDVLPPGDKERGLYENFLVGARSLPAPTKKDEAAVKQQKLF